jgi:hypothetical protein
VPGFSLLFNWVSLFKRTKTFGLAPVNIYVLTKMPRDCTAPPCYGKDNVMNSPVSCLPDPIQNMRKSILKNTQKQKKTLKKRMARPTSYIQHLTAPVSYGMVSGGKRNLPIGAMTPGKMIVKNYEQSVVWPNGNTAFQDSGLWCNPGIAATFPWLSGIAQNYQKFRFLFLRFFFSSSVATSTAGKVWMQLSYDGEDGAPASLAAALASEDSSAGPAWFGGAVSDDKAFAPDVNGDANIYVDVDCSKLTQPWYYVRNSVAAVSPSSGGALAGTIPSGLMFTQGDYLDESSLPCRLFYGSNNLAAISPGEMYAAYIVEFIEPVAPASST